MTAEIIAVGLRRCPALLALTIGLGLLTLGRRTPLVIYNATPSAPVGFYRVGTPATLKCGDLVLVRTPDAFRELAATRGYLPEDVPLVKRVIARSGATVCARDGAVTIDGQHAAVRRSTDREGRALPAWSGCRRLAANEIFLLMIGVPDSLDSRYFGPVPMNAVIGVLSPLWLR